MPKDGGYLLRRLKYDLVKKRAISEDLPRVYGAVNYLQAVPWRVNVPLLEAAKAVWDSGLVFEGMPSRQEQERPPEPDYKTDPEAWARWKRKSGDIFRNNRKLKTTLGPIKRLISLAELFSDKPSIWFPVSLDFRGRFFYKPELLHPQDNDLSKALLTFSGGKPLGKDGAFWLGVHVANTFGEDRISLQARHEWAERHSDQIVRCAADPLEHRWWTDADKPFRFLAACLEWSGYLREGPSYVSSLPVSVDGSCNGIQHFSAMLRDEICGEHVNLIPKDRPADLYGEVANDLKRRLEEVSKGSSRSRAKVALLWLAYGIDRKLCKEAVLPLPYGITARTIREKLKDHVIDSGRKAHFGDRLNDAVRYLYDFLEDSMDSLIVRPRRVMAWLQQVSRIVGESGHPVTWVTPSGFPVSNRYNSTKGRRVTLRACGKTYSFTLDDEVPGMDTRQQNRSIVANFVHSMDASALTLTTHAADLRGIRHFSAVHDSFGTLAADMPVLIDCIRQSFVKMYQENDVLMQLKERMEQMHGVRLPPPPERGQLDLTGVLASDYFFA
jgi:DNA-directed RNA polymerase